MQEVNIKISKKIADILQKRVDENDEFKNVEEYVNYILGQVVERLEKESKKEDEQIFNEEDKAKIKQRLKNLGYL